MLAQNVVLLDEARAQWAQALHVRRLCQSITDKRAIEALTDYAEELEKHAAELEASVGRTAQLTSHVADEITKATETLIQINSALSQTAPGKSVG